jgi:hypothetical protein
MSPKATPVGTKMATSLVPNHSGFSRETERPRRSQSLRGAERALPARRIEGQMKRPIDFTARIPSTTPGSCSAIARTSASSLGCTGSYSWCRTIAEAVVVMSIVPTVDSDKDFRRGCRFRAIARLEGRS